MSDDLAIIARDLKLPFESIKTAVRLLDEGNAIPFVARFRKDLTGGLDADQLSAIKQRVGELRALAERKSFVLKSIESQGKLTEELSNEINRSTNSRRLEDLYLPFKPKKQSLAMTARQQGLEPLANEIFAGERPDIDLPSRATEFVRVDKGTNSVDEVISGVRYLIAERLSEFSELRRELRKILWQSAQLTCKLVQSDEATAEKSSSAVAGAEPTVASQELPAATEVTAKSSDSVIEAHTEQSADAPDAASGEPEATDAASTAAEVAGETPSPADGTEAEVSTEATQPPDAEAKPGGNKGKKRRKPKKKKPTTHPFADYDNFTESVKRIPNHRVLAINRGERSGQLKVKIKADSDSLERRAIELLVPAEHPFKPFMEECVRDALHRMVLPSLEREVRRELTDVAERHAVQVFAHNLKALLLRPPVRAKRVLAIDPGYKNGCSIAILDPQGNLLHTDRLFIVGNDQRREENRKKLAELIRNHQVDLITIGNGTACREAEIMVSDAIAMELADLAIKYVIVNEAGASIYSTSEIGKEELPDLLPHARSAVSIGRRLLDPLSELVKISPGNLGVGLYQHDIKAKHLSESLDEVVESCVNFVGVNTDTASPALLGYVAGLNQLTARRLVEYRTAHPIKSRQSFREVPGIGEATFVQSAGFLRVYGGDNPLDETAIHPESYAIAEKVLEKVGVSPVEWLKSRHTPSSSTTTETVDENDAGLKKLQALNPRELAQEFGVGELMMRDIIQTLERPTHDPRQNFNGPVFRSGIIKIEDLKPEMELQSQVVNVVDFGVFVDVGLGFSCLVHVSELSPGYIRDLHQQFAVGDSLLTWVKEIDAPRRRVKLTAIKPGTPKAERPPRHRRDDRRPRRENQATAGSPPNTAGQPGTVESGRSGDPNRRSDRRGQHSGQPRGQQTGQPQSGSRQSGQRERKPGRFERPRYQNQGHRSKSDGPKVFERSSKPKPVVPITKEMIEGKKPMRSFSDLAQFFTKPKSEDDSKE
jgi:protein Tex